LFVKTCKRKFLHEIVVETTKQKGERRRRLEPEEQEGMP
jgi:hypothetical protein